MDEFVTKHVGGLISPPNTVERLTELGPLVEYEFEVSMNNPLFVSNAGFY